MKRKIKYINLIMIISLMCLTIKSNAAMEIKPGTTTWTNITVSESYQQSYNLRRSDSTLGNNSLDPHLILNKDWGTAAYLAVSPYGAVNSSSSPTTTVNGKSYTTTNGNATGVLNMGETHTQTSSLISGYTDNVYIANLKNNVGTKYVETLSAENTVANTLGQAFAETAGWWGLNTGYPDSSNPVGIRSKVLGFFNGNVFSGYYPAQGRAYSNNTTFRVAIWN